MTQVAEDRPGTDLNSQQASAVNAEPGPCLVVAGPGSGKTSVIIARIQYLIQVLDIPPRHIMAVTFTNRAAREMGRRLTRALGQDIADEVHISTFHSWGASFLRKYAHLADRSPNFSIYDEDDTLQTIRRLLAERNADGVEPGDVLRYITDRKHRRVHPDADPDRPTSPANLFHDYQVALTNANALDFDDLMEYPLAILENNPEVLEQTRRRHQHLLIDEYQDTNHSQRLLATIIAGTGPEASIYVVGDPDQSIYSFRYADINNILQFQEDYPTAALHRLEYNYRSSPEIAGAAQAVIESNTQRISRSWFTQQPPGRPLAFFAADNPHQEAAWITRTVRRNIDQEGATLNEFAVAYRTNAQAWVIEDAMRRQGIPYRVRGGFDFFQRREIRIYLDYLRLANNPLDENAMDRIINTPPRRVGAKVKEALTVAAMEQDLSVNSIIYALADGDSSLTRLSQQIGPKVVQSLNDFVVNLVELRQITQDRTLPELLDFISREYAVAEHIQSARDGEKRWGNVEELLNLALYVETGPEWLTQFLTRTAMTNDHNEDNETLIPHVTLTTLHQTKGLEFDRVFIVGVEDGLLPHYRAGSPDDIEEERRLLFVGMTRARKHLAISACRERPENRGSRKRRPSPFLWDIPEELWNRPPWRQN